MFTHNQSIFPLNADHGRYLMIHKLSQGTLNCNQTKTCMNLETDTKEEKEIKVEKQTATPTSFTTKRPEQKVSSTEHELTGENKEPSLHVDMIKKGMSGVHTCTKLTMIYRLLCCSDINTRL